MGKVAQVKAPQIMAAEAKKANEDLMKKAEQIANDEKALLARSDPYQTRVGFTAKQIQDKGDARLASDLKRVHKQGKADKKLAKQLQRAAQNTDAIGDPYEVSHDDPRGVSYKDSAVGAKPRKLGRSGKDIAARQARVASRRQADARLQKRMRQLQGSVVRPTAPQKVPPAAMPQYTISSPPRGKKRPLMPIQDIARAFAQASQVKRGRFGSAFSSSLTRGNMLVDLMNDIP